MKYLFHILVYPILIIGMCGVFLVDDIIKEVGYFFVVILMIDLMYKRYYSHKHTEKNK